MSFPGLQVLADRLGALAAEWGGDGGGGRPLPCSPAAAGRAVAGALWACASAGFLLDQRTLQKLAGELVLVRLLSRWVMLPC